jgi:biopolymer transport protein ExbD
MKLQQEAVAPARSQMIPLIDCMFLILVSFIYAFLGMTENRGIPLHLPNAAVKAVLEKEIQYTVSIDEAGGVYLDGAPTLVNRLGPAIAIRYVPGETLVLLQGDVAARHGRVVEVLDNLRLAGITKVSVQTSPLSQGSAASE